MIPKRAVAAIVTTTFALVLLFSFKTPGADQLARASGGSAVVGEPSPASGGSAGSSSSIADGATSSTPAPTSGGTGATGGSGTSTATYRDGTYDGTDIQTRYGDVQIELKVAGGSITDVATLLLPSGDRHSSRISDTVSPILRSEVLTAQSAQIDLVSGATYTSTAYVQSLQAAIDKARA